VAGEQPTFQDLAKKTQELRQQLVLAKIDLAEMEVTGSADGGLVTVTMRGDGEVTRVVIDQAAVDEGDAESLAATTLTAIRRASEALKALTAERLADLTASFDVAGSAGASRPRM